MGERGRRTPWWVPALILAATVAQLAVATFVPGLEQFEGKGFAHRLVLYPLLMLTAPLVWWLTTQHRRRPPYAAFALIMLPFLIDVTGNTVDLYDTVDWWDNANHFVNWIPLCAGLGLLLTAGMTRRWQIVLLVTGLGAALAVGWELGEYVSFIRRGTELEGAYEDTLSDEGLGTLGALIAGLWVAYAGPGRGESKAQGPPSNS